MLTSKNPSFQLWIDEVNQALPRCLALMDRQALSKTYGCFDKAFWHFRTKDFASAAAQMSVLSLAKILDLQEREIIETPWSKEELLHLIQAGFDYTWTLQHQDGSFDEWYPNERGWGGPGGYVLYALCETFQILQKHSLAWDPKIYLPRIRLSASFQSGKPESGTLANHYAISMLSLWKAYEITQDDDIKNAYFNLRKRFLNLCSKEGWSLEYDGFDASYNLATVSFLSRISEIGGDDELRIYCAESLKFISFFVYPDGSFSGSLSSRHTSHNYPYAWAFWADSEAIASEITLRSLQGKLLTKTPRIADQDDHYIHYRLWDVLDAIAILPQRALQKRSPLPWEKLSFTENFAGAGILVSLQKERYLVLSYKRGGAFLLFDVSKKQRIQLLNNYLLKEKSGRLLSPQFMQTVPVLLEIDSEGFRFQGAFEWHPVFNSVFSPSKNILFRLFLCLVQWAPFSAHSLKGLIRRWMILDRKKAKTRLTRTLKFTWQGLVLKDVVEVPRVQGQILSSATEIFSRYVPQSRYFDGLEKIETQKIVAARTERHMEVSF